ncbi:MAG: type II secretion system protein [Candidatus Gracilibacteria bacterium]
MINIKKQGFTLVELIVVITILAILGSIAFISLQGYSSDARNSKRTSDLSSIQSSLTVKQTSGTDLTAFVANTTTANTLTSLSIGGQTPTGKYFAGAINYNALGMKGSDFQDPQSNANYVAGVTSLIGGAYQIAASMEQSGGARVARVVGNYNPRTSPAAVNVLTGSTSVTLSASTDINKFKPQDVVSLNGGGASTGTVSRVSADGMTLTLSTGSTTATTVTLFAPETAGLIGSGSSANVVEDNGSTYLPY